MSFACILPSRNYDLVSKTEETKWFRLTSIPKGWHPVIPMATTTEQRYYNYLKSISTAQAVVRTKGSFSWEIYPTFLVLFNTKIGRSGYSLHLYEIILVNNTQYYRCIKTYAPKVIFHKMTMAVENGVK